MDERPQPIIIKKIKKNAAGAHGGSWKVAYADFVTAMMAFFLMLWLLSMVSEEKKAALSEYFEKYSMFQAGGKSAVTTKDTKMTDPNFITPVKQDASAVGTLQGNKKGESFRRMKQKVDIKDEDSVKKIRASIDKKMAGIRDQILVDVVEGGIRIQIIDMEGSEMFASGSIQPTPKAKAILNLLSVNLKEMPGRIIVEGHTDSSPFQRGGLTNWELSTSRASSARKLLDENGIDSTRIARVVGYADTELLVPLNSLDPRNRRISLIILNPNPKADKSD